jgi:hypothetical protein
MRIVEEAFASTPKITERFVIAIIERRFLEELP